MNKYTQIIILLFISVLSCAQIPNNGFENWTLISGFQTPSDWDNLNQMTHNKNIYTCVEGTPGYTGTSYLFLTSKTVAGKGVVPGVAVCGIIDTITYKAKSGFPFTSRPQYLSCYMQYMPSDPSDSSSIKVLLTKWDQLLLKRDTIAFGASYFNGMAHNWYNNSTNLNYFNGNNPDSAIIIISSSGSNPKPGSYIYIDDLLFNGSVIGIDETILSTNNVSIFPNPSSDILIIDINSNQKTSLDLTVYDSFGKLVYQKNLSNARNIINTSQWSKGIYTIRFKNNSFVKQVVIN